MVTNEVCGVQTVFAGPQVVRLDAEWLTEEECDQLRLEFRHELGSSQLLRNLNTISRLREDNARLKLDNSFDRERVAVWKEQCLRSRMLLLRLMLNPALPPVSLGRRRECRRVLHRAEAFLAGGGEVVNG